MDLRNNTIKMSELLSNPEAKAIIVKEFPEFASPFMLSMARSMTLAAVLKLAGNRVSQSRIENAVNELEEL